MQRGLCLRFRGSGASGLLRESRENLSLWFAAISGLIFISTDLLAGALLYEWVGYPWAVVWAAFVVLDRVWA
jgi:hypothetical protein